MKLEVREIPPKPVEVEKEYVLTLTEKEASIITHLLASITFEPIAIDEFHPGFFTQNLFKQLVNNSHVSPMDKFYPDYKLPGYLTWELK